MTLLFFSFVICHCVQLTGARRSKLGVIRHNPRALLLLRAQSPGQTRHARLTWLTEVRLRSSSSMTSLSRVGWWCRGMVSQPGAA